MEQVVFLQERTCMVLRGKFLAKLWKGLSVPPLDMCPYAHVKGAMCPLNRCKFSYNRCLFFYME